MELPPLLGVALESAEPATAMRETLKQCPSRATHLVAIGKAAAPMARAFMQVRRVRAGIIVTQEAGVALLHDVADKIQVYAADHPVPTARNVEAATAVRAFCESLGEADYLALLISGGGSAHLALPAGKLTLHDLEQATTALLRVAPIEELNCVRKHCEQLKGGRLAALTYPADTDVYVLSDVIGDPLDVIASGPATPDGTSPADALRVLKDRGLVDALPRIVEHLRTADDPPGPDDERLLGVSQEIVHNNEQSLGWMRFRAPEFGLNCVDLVPRVTGDAAAIGAEMAERGRRLGEGECLVFGGETTVQVVGDGKGGRNQHMALAAAKSLRGEANLVFMTLATDGIDGPTDAAGAVVDGGTWDKALALGLDPEAALRNCDSHTLLDAVGVLIRTGPTLTNVCDVGAVVRSGDLC